MARVTNLRGDPRRAGRRPLRAVADLAAALVHGLREAVRRAAEATAGARAAPAPARAGARPRRGAAVRFPCALVAAAAIAAVPAGGCSDLPEDSGEVAEVATYTVARRDLRVTISEKGTLKTANQVLVRPKIPGQAKIVTLVDEGTIVGAGDVLCELDRTEVQRTMQDLENRVIALKGDLAAAEAELEIQLSENESDVRDAELAKRFADVELERWIHGTDVDERARREVRVTVSRSERDRAQRRFEQMPDLEKEGFVTKDQVEEERINVLKSDSEVRLAELDLDNYLRYTSPKDKEQREADVRNAELEVGRAKQRSAAREAQRRSAVERQRLELTNTEARLAEARDTFENMIVRAPAPGLVLYGDSRNPWEDRQIKVGETVYANQPFLTLPDLSSMLVVVAVHEADISRVRPGLKAYISVETAREQTLAGKVARVAPVAAQANSRWSDGVKRFNVEVTLEGDLAALGLKPGLTGKVEILLDELEDVLAVPQQAIFSQRGAFHAFVAKGGAAVRTPVTIEAGNSQYVVVTGGLSEGDTVLLYNPEAAGGAAAPPDGGEAPSKPRDGETGTGGDARKDGAGAGAAAPANGVAAPASGAGAPASGAGAPGGTAPANGSGGGRTRNRP